MAVRIVVGIECDQKKLVDALDRHDRSLVAGAGGIHLVFGHCAHKSEGTVGVGEDDFALLGDIDHGAGYGLAVGINHTAFDFMLAGSPERERACEQQGGRQEAHRH